MIRNNSTKSERKKTIQSRVTRRFVPVIMVAFLVVGLASLFGIRAAASDNLARVHTDILENVNHRVAEELGSLREDLRQIANEPGFQQSVSQIQLGGQILDPQTEILRQFTLLMRRYPSTYLAIRYINPEGLIQAEVVNRNGTPFAEAEIRAFPSEKIAELVQAEQADANVVLMTGPYSYIDLENPQLEEEALSLYTPVVDIGGAGSATGVVQLEVAADVLYEPLAETTYDVTGTRRVLLLGNQGELLSQIDGGSIISDETLSRPEASLDEFLTSNAANLQVESWENWTISSRPITLENAAGMPWRAVIMENTDAALGASNVLSLLVLVAAVVIGGLVVLIIQSLLNNLLTPLDTARDFALRLAEGSVSEFAPTSSSLREYDDLAELVSAFNVISGRIDHLKTELEDEAERRKRNLDVAARMSRETATLRDVDTLMNRAIDLICNEFGFYHAQVFLLDDIRINAVLVYSRGEAGQKMLASKHKIPVGSSSVIGQVTATGRPVVVDDTESEDAPHAFNPLLPDTRAEMALPLQIGEEVIGALDIQSTEPHAFKREDVRAFQMLADQIAIAIHNTQLLLESERRVQQVNSLNRQLTEQKWQEVEEKLGLTKDYTYNLLQVETDDNVVAPSSEELSAAIVIRGQEIGRLSAALPEGQEFGEGDRMILQAVADRVALAIENARLFQETQTTLAETSILYQLSNYLNNANSLQDVLEAIIYSIMSDASGGQVLIFEEYPAQGSPEIATVTTDLVIRERDEDVSNLEGMEFYIPDSAFLSALPNDRVTIISDASRDSRLDSMMKSLFSRLRAISVVMIPLNVRGTWRGLIVVNFPRVRNFSERDGRIYTALIDQAGVAIENRLLLQQTEATLSQIERLYTASRIINSAQSLQDLIRATISSSSDARLDFALGILEGELDENNWPTRIHMVARSEGTNVYDLDDIMPIYIAADSPMRRREPEIVNDANADDIPQTALVISMRERGMRFSAAFPLFVSRDQPVAIFFITSQEAYQLSEEDHEVYRAITGQMSTVLQNRRLLEQTEVALNETRRLYDASRAISSAQDSNAIYETIWRHLLDAAPEIHRVAVLLSGPNPALNALYLDCVFLWTNQPDDSSMLRINSRINTDSMPVYQLFQNVSGTVVLTDLDIDLAYQNRLRLALEFPNTRSTLIAPMFSRQKWFGVILCQSAREGAFDNQFARFTQAIADQVAIAVENRQLFEEAQMEAQRALALAEAGQFANRISGDFERNLREVFARVSQAANYDRWLLMVVRDVPGRLEQVTLQAPGLQESEEHMFLDLRTARHSIADAARDNMTILINDPAHYPAFGGYTDPALEILGKHIVAPVGIGGEIIGALMIGRGLEAADLNERDEQLVNTLAAQVAVALENQRLLRETENERQTLSSTLEALPAGVLVLDADTYRPLQFNDQVETLLDRAIRMDEPFDVVDYRLYQTGTGEIYPEEALPIFTAAVEGHMASSSDVAVLLKDGRQTDLLLNAAPIRDANGNITAIVAAFEDITHLRSLEKALQETLSETITLYEATRALAEAKELDEVLDTTLGNLTMTGTSDCFILIRDEETDELRPVRSQRSHPPRFDLPLAILNNNTRLIVEDTRNTQVIDEATQVALTARDISAFMSIPLRGQSRDLSLGWLVLVYDEVHHFDSDEERFLTTLADSASIAIDNRSLFRSTQRALEETAALYNATTTINRANEMNDLSHALREALEWMQPDLYACYLQTSHEIGHPLTQLFNVNLDGAEADFAGLIQRHKLLRDQNLFIEDLKLLRNPSPMERDLVNMGNIRAVASVSLRIKGSPNGRLIVAYHQPRRFKESDTRYLYAVADSASVVIDNVLLFDQIQSALEETSILYQANRALTDADSAEDILQAVVNYLIQPHINQVFMALLKSKSWESAGANVEVVAHWKQTGEQNLLGQGFNNRNMPWWRLLTTPSVLTIDNVATDPALDQAERDHLQSLGFESLVVIPLRSAQNALGVICLGAEKAHRHNERDQRVYQAFAEQTSLSMEATRALEQASRRARQLETSAEVSRSANSILDLQALLDRAVNLIRDSFGYDHAQVFLMDEDDDFAVLRASTGEAGQKLLSINHKLQRGSASVIGQVTEKNIPIIAADTADARYVHRPNPYLPNTRSEMAIPLTIQNRVVGALDVQSNAANAFTDEDVAVLGTLAAQISVAIANARLFERAEHRASDMSLLFDVTLNAASADSIDEALQNVAEKLAESMDTQAVAIYLPQSYVDEKNDDLIVMLQPVGFTSQIYQVDSIASIRVGDPDNMIGLVAGELSPQIVGDVDEQGNYQPVVPGAKSAVIMPLEAANNLVGLIVMESAQPFAFDSETLTLLLTLSGTLSAIIQNAQLLDQAQRTAEQLRELDRLKTDFLANMSHELRTPLNSIIGFSRVILKGIDGPLTEMQEQDLTTIYNSGQHLLNLINDILDQAKIAAGKMDLQSDYFEVKQVIDGVRSIGIGLVKDKPIDIRVEVAPGLPKAYGDEFRTRQVLLNLISNAAKFTQQGSITIAVYLIRDPETHLPMVRVDVTDTGIGIAEKDIPLLFEAFRQVDSSLTRTAGGTGLGLPIAKSLIEMQHGRMEVRSEVNVGSTFTITIPTEPYVEQEKAEGEPEANNGTSDTVELKSAEVSPAQTMTMPSVMPGVTGPLRPLTTSMLPMMPPKRQILVIEDNPDMVDQFRRSLRNEGFDILAASIPLEAEAMASGLRPTIIIMDVNFANGAGWEILRKLKDRDDTFDIPVIVVTLSDEVERAVNAGAFVVIQRPFVPEELIEAALKAEEESNTERILIIDDQPEATHLIKQLLDADGRYRVFAAHSGTEGVSMVARRRPDLVLLDLRMPEMDGFAVLQELRSNPETIGIPVVVVTGETLNEDERDLLIDIPVIYKNEFHQDNVSQLIKGVRSHLSRANGD